MAGMWTRFKKYLAGPEYGPFAERASLPDELSYHDLHITTAEIPRTSIFDLHYGLAVVCTRVGGWQLWDQSRGLAKSRLLAGEYDGPEKWLVLDVAGHVIVDSRR